jgi:Ca2+-binding EF-hand superfamily protein
MLRFIVPALAGLVLLVPSVNADDNKAKKKKGPDLDTIFAKIDANKDGKLAPAEFAGAMAELKKKKDAAQSNNTAKAGKKAGKKAGELFTKLDANKDGSLSLDEFKKLPEVMKEMKKKKDK